MDTASAEKASAESDPLEALLRGLAEEHEGEQPDMLPATTDADITEESLGDDLVAGAPHKPLSSEDLSDLELANAFIDGSDSAFIQLYAKYETPVLVYCRRMVADSQLAEDVFQDLWVRIFRLRAREVHVKHFRGLLFKSARNLCLNLLRLEKNRYAPSEPLATARASDESSAAVEQSELIELIARGLQKLPFSQREAFVMHEYSGFSYEEIAQALGTTEENVKVRAFRARLRLRKLISSWLGLGEDDDPTSAI